MSAAFPAPAWLVGCGNMAGAMVAGWRAAGIDLGGVTAIRPSGAPVEGLRVVTDLPDERPRFVMLGMKPQKLDEVAPALAPHIGEDTILVSMLAGTGAASLAARFPAARSIVRVMPNLPVASRNGVTAIYSDTTRSGDRATVDALMGALGLVVRCEDEAMFAAIGAVAGSGPAYVARFVDALATGGEGLGLEPHVATAVAAATLIGTAAMAATGEPMADIARRVASPRGTTEQGLAVLDAPGGLGPLVERMLAAAIARGEQLAKDAAAAG
ncbi:pyrroline-5-carboxylate reductase dimerization domain-containing protein [Sphingomonas sp. ASV193]|uniref:pyrroline-5-carboxylate reductase family protein n=1 Tax=Sphingomonas sp. ASV193 TaxID=3144405 RepID=UPI0032E90AC3